MALKLPYSNGQMSSFIASVENPAPLCSHSSLKVKVNVYTGIHHRALRKGSQLVLTLARAPLRRNRETTETNEDPAGCQSCDPACA